MKIVITGSLGNVGKPLTRQLLAEGHTVTVVSSQEARKKEIEQLGAQAAIGSVSDAAFLTTAFSGAEAVFAMTPPNMGGSNIVANIVAAGKALATAIKASQVPRVVMLSSMGADQPEGTGPIKSVHQIEQLYRQLDQVSVTYLRAGFFYTNFYNDVPMIKTAGIMGSNYPANIAMPLVHPADIAAAAAEELVKKADGHHVRYIISDIRSPREVAGILGAAVGKPELSWAEFSDEQSLQGMVQAGVPEEIAGLYTEMGAGFRKGIVAADFQKNGAPITGPTKLEAFAQEFAEVF